jgi:hypothetical protein
VRVPSAATRNLRFLPIVTELENPFGDAKERHKRRPREAECTDAPTRLGLLHSSEETE